MALTNRHRLSILIGFLVISEIFYITLMIKLPDDIMQREKAQNFVEQVGKYIPKIRALQQLAQLDEVPDVMPLFYAVVCLWCLVIWTCAVFIFRLYCLFGNDERLKKLGKIKSILVLFAGAIFCFILFFMVPIGKHYRNSYGELIYGFKTSAAIFGAIHETFFYIGMLIAMDRLIQSTRSYYRRGDANV